MQETVLITGAGGFTANYLAPKLLELGYRVVLLGQQGEQSDDYYVANLLDSERLADIVRQCRPDVVIHLAAVSFVAHSDVSAMYMTNVVGTRNLLSALAGSDYAPRQVILASTANVYKSVEGARLSEDSELMPGNDYGVSKLAMEHLAQLWRNQLPIVLVRPFNYTGCGQSTRFVIPKIVDHFARGERCIELGNLDVYRDFSDVRDIASYYAGLIQSEVRDGVYNFCSGGLYSLSEIIDSLSDIAGYAIEVRVNPEFVRSNEIKSLCGDSAALAGLTGSLQVTPLKETLAWMYSQYDKH